MTVQLSLSVNGAPIKTDYFVEAFIDHTLSGMVESLEGTAPIKTLNLDINDGKVSVNLNGRIVPTNAFVNKIVSATIVGMVTPLKGVSDPKKITIDITK